MEVSTVLMAPIAPHIMDHVWVNLLKKEGTVLTTGWPSASEPNYGLQQAAAYLEDFITSQRRSKQKLESKGKAKKGMYEWIFCLVNRFHFSHLSLSLSLSLYTHTHTHTRASFCLL